MSGAEPHIIIVDDDLAMGSTAKVLLENAGYRVSLCDSAIRALEEIPRQRPVCVLLDILMPEMDGLELCRQLREMPELPDLKILMFSAKAFKYDRARAAELGADGYILKPINPKTFLDQVRKAVEDKIALTFWGVRGTLPRPGRDSVRYGGNTNCVTLEFPKGPLFILDAGTGIKSLSDHLMAGEVQRIEAKILISHPHWDHINSLPFFSPLYITGNDFEIIGADQAGISVRDFVSAQMDGVYFPITIREFGARVEFRDLREGQYQVGSMRRRDHAAVASGKLPGLSADRSASPRCARFALAGCWLRGPSRRARGTLSDFARLRLAARAASRLRLLLWARPGEARATTLRSASPRCARDRFAEGVQRLGVEHPFPVAAPGSAPQTRLRPARQAAGPPSPTSSS